MSSDVFLYSSMSFLRVVSLRNQMPLHLSDASKYRWPDFLGALHLFGQDAKFITPFSCRGRGYCAVSMYAKRLTCPMWMRIASRIASKLSCAEEESEGRFLLCDTRTTTTEPRHLVHTACISFGYYSRRRKIFAWVLPFH